MINTQFGGRLSFSILPDGKFVPESSQGNHRSLLEEAQGIYDSFSSQAQQLARLDNLGAETPPEAPGFLEKLFRPSKSREYQARVKEWNSQTHGEDHDVQLGVVELRADSNDKGLDARMSFQAGQQGRYGGIALNSLEYKKVRSYYDSYSGDGGGVGGSDCGYEKEITLEASMERQGQKDVIQVRLDNGFVGLRTLTIDWESGTGTILGQVSRSDQGEFFLPSLRGGMFSGGATYTPSPTVEPELKPSMSWADRQAVARYNNADWKERQRLDSKAGGDYRATVKNLDNLPSRQRQKTEYRLGL